MRVNSVPEVKTPRIAAVIVTHDRLAGLKRGIDAVRAQTLPVAAIIVVNNASSDGTREWLGTQADLVAIHQGDEGPAGGMYSGIAYAHENRFDAAWTLDDDALPDELALERLVAAEANDGSNVVCSLVVSVEDPELLAFAVPRVSSYSRLLDHHPKLIETVADLRAASNGLGYPWSMFTNSMLLPRHVVDKVGLPKREFYMGAEDTEYHYRIRSHGFGTYIVLDSICRHPRRRLRDAPMWRQKSLVRNTVYIHRRYRRWFFLRTTRLFLVFAISGRWPLLRALWDGVREDFSARYADSAGR
jgi:rhamnopyranosyl-N-acetylglucosaminyl-diphospho-decaprenol beta-1,3/1,4-galactofuranosyltransferase